MEVPSWQHNAHGAAAVRVEQCLRRLRRHHALAHVIDEGGSWSVAERSVTGAAALDWLCRGTAIASTLATERGALSVDLSTIPVATIRRSLRATPGTQRDTIERTVLQLTVEQAAALGEECALRRRPCHVVVQRDELPALAAARRHWPPLWTPVFPRALGATAQALGDEPFGVVTPRLRLCLPPGAAVLPVSVSIRPYWLRDRFDCQAMRAALGEIVRAADALFDELQWPLAADVWDAYQHRRLALIPRALGGLTNIAGVADDGERAVAFLRSVLTHFNDSVRQHSAALAQRDGCYAALSAELALGHLVNRPDYAQWRERWQSATRGQVCRHRNLTMVCMADLWAGSSIGRHPSAWGRALNVVDGVGFGERWPAIVAKLGHTPAFGHLAATLIRSSDT
ncbi:MAG: hypothetical protein AAGC71_00870 [Pseudomonadota bacterium]